MGTTLCTQVNIIIPFEMCRHITAIFGFVGGKVLPTHIILALADIPEHYAQHLRNGAHNAKIGIIATEKGWVDNEAKVAYAKFCIEEPTCRLGR